MKKSILLLALSMTVVAILAGCSKQVKLGTGMANSKAINSCAYDITLSIDGTGIKDNSLDTGATAAMSNMLSSKKVSLNFNGKMLKTADRSKISSNVKVSTGGASFEAPVYIDSSNTKFDFELFVALPDILKNRLGIDLTNITNVYLTSADIESNFKKKISAVEYKKFQDSMTKAFDKKSNKNAKVSEEMLITVNNYLTKNKAKVKTFEKLGDAKTSENGIYTIKLTKEDIKMIISDYFNNEAYFNNYKTYVKEVEGLSSASSGDVAKPVNVDNAKTVIADYNKVLDDVKTMDIVVKFTIENEVTTKTNIKFDIVNSAGNVKIEIDSKLSDINKVTSIVAPDKNSEKTLNIMKLNIPEIQ